MKLEKKNKKYNYEIYVIKLKSVQSAKDLGIKTESNPKFSQQCNDAANKANRKLGFITRNFSRNKNVVLPLYNNLFTLLTMCRPVHVSPTLRKT